MSSAYNIEVFPSQTLPGCRPEIPGLRTLGKALEPDWAAKTKDAYEELHERILTRSRYHQEQILTRNRMSRGILNFDELYLRGYWELEVNQGIRVYLRE